MSGPRGSEQRAGRPRDRAERWSWILDQLATRGRLGVPETAEVLQVSTATVRRDFHDLDRRGMVNRSHGGIVAAAVAYELPYRYRSTAEDDERARIARHTAELVRGDRAVAFNGGTTTTATARSVTALRGSEGEALTLVTNALNIASEAVLRPGVRCICLGGVARPESYEVSGALAMATLAQLWCDTAVIGVDAISAAEGASCTLDDEALVVRTMMEQARRTVCVAAGAKVGQRALTRICPADRVHDLVTSASADEDELARLRDRGVRVHLV